MKKITIAILSIVLIMSISTTSAFAGSASNQVVTMVGYSTDSTNGTGTFISITPNPDSCFGVWFNNDLIKTQALSIGIAAFAAGRKINVTYTKNGTSTCYGTGIFLVP